MKFILTCLLSLIAITSFSQRVEAVTEEKIGTVDLEKYHYSVMGQEDKIKLAAPKDLLLDFSKFDYPIAGMDSVSVTVSNEKFVFTSLTPFIVKDVEKETNIDVVMYHKGDTLSFIGSDAKVLSISAKVSEPPLLTEDKMVFGLLAIVLGIIFFTANSSNPSLRKFYTVIPALLLCYLIPGLLSTFGIISSDYSGLYTSAKNYMLPAALILMTLGIDFKGIINLGPKALIMFFAGTIGIMLGGPIAIWVYKFIDPEVVGGVGDAATWKGLTTLAGSWIGGGANQMAMLEYFKYKQEFFGKMIVVDIVVAQLWMIFLLWGAARHQVFDRWLKADGSAIEDLKKRMESYEAQNARKPELKDYMLILGLTFGLVGLAHWLGDFLGPYFENLTSSTNPLSSKFFWLIVICTGGALIFAATKVRRFEGAGASKIGSVFIYLLVAIIGMKMDISKALEEPELILVGIIWMAFHAGLLFLIAKWIKAPFFFLAVGSKANVGGAASAPVVAAAFHPSLASVGVLLAVLGYAIGTIAAMICGFMMGAVAP